MSTPRATLRHSDDETSDVESLRTAPARVKIALHNVPAILLRQCVQRPLSVGCCMLTCALLLSSMFMMAYLSLWLCLRTPVTALCEHRLLFWYRLAAAVCAGGVFYTASCSFFFRQFRYKYDLPLMLDVQIAQRLLRRFEPLALAALLAVSSAGAFVLYSTDTSLCPAEVRAAHMLTKTPLILMCVCCVTAHRLFASADKELLR